MKARRVLALAVLAVTAPLTAQEPARPDTTRRGAMEHGMQSPMMQGMMEPGMMQDPTTQGMTQMPEMMGPMMRGMGFNPANLLMRKEALGLTTQQETRLTALRDAAKAAHDAAAAEAKTHIEALAQAMAATTPNTNAAKQHFQAAHAAMGRAHWAMLEAAAQAKAALTDGQRGRVEGWADARQAGMGQMMQMMGMKDCPMMRGGMPGNSMMPPRDK